MNAEKIKAICLDLDGTLLNDDKKISDRNLRALRYLNAKGIRIIIATGRQYPSAKALLRSLGFPVFIIYSNGAGVRCTGDDHLLLSHYIREETYWRVLELQKGIPLGLMINVDYYEQGPDAVWLDGLFSPYAYSYSKRNHLRLQTILTVDDYYDKILSIVFIGRMENLFQMEKRILGDSDLHCNCHVMKSESDISLFELMDPEGEKGNILEELSCHLGFSVKDVVAFGDNMNDIGMLKRSGLGIVMRNGVKEIWPYADRITSHSNNADGVAMELAQLFAIDLEF